jgi:hypothetical protein
VTGEFELSNQTIKSVHQQRRVGLLSRPEVAFDTQMDLDRV